MHRQHTDKRMFFGLTALLFLMAVFGGYSIFKSITLSQLTDKLYRHPFTVGTNVRDINTNILAIHRDMKDVAIATDIPEMENILLDVDALDKDVMNRLIILEERFLGEKEHINQFSKDFDAWRPIRKQVIDYAGNGQNEQAIKITQGKGKRHVELLLKELNDITEFANNKANEFHDSAKEQGTDTIWSISLLLIFAMVASCVISILLMHNVMLRRRQFERLRESEENLATTVRSIGDGVIVTSNDGDVLQMNPVAENLTGWVASEALGEKLDKIFHIINEDTRLPVESPVVKVLREGCIVGMANHTLLISRDGSEIPIADSAAPIMTKGEDNFFGVVMVFRDQIEERRAELQIKHLNNVLRSVRNVNQLITHQKDSHILLQEICQSLTETRGYNYVWIASMDPKGNPIQFCQAGGEGKFSYFAECIENGKYPDCVKKVISQKKLYLIENVHKNCSNCEFANLNNKYKALIISLWHDDRMYGVLFAHMPKEIEPSAEEQQLFTEVAADIAYALHGIEQERIHKILKRRMDKQQQLLDLTGYMAKVGGWEYNVDTEEFTFTSETARIHGLSVSDTLCLRHIIELYKDGHRKSLESAIDKAIKLSQPFDLELALEISGSQSKWIRACGRAVVEAGDVAWLTGTFQDVTERQQIELNLRQHEKMEAVGQLAGGIAHDFNNQLACIMGYAELLAHNISDPKLSIHARNIIVAATHSADLTKQLLAYSRKGKFLSQPVDMHSIVNEVVSFVKHSFDKRINITQTLLAKHSTIIGDPSQLQNCILNLALNARDAMADGGNLLISTRLVTLKEKAFDFDISEGEYIEVSVSDTGYGMSADIIEHVYEPFFTTKEQGKGTGLGLSSVFGTVKSHKGAITVYSELGKGTIFKLYFPVLPNMHKQSENKPDKLVAPVQNTRLLVVDDEPMVCDLLTSILRQIGYKVVPFTDPQKALEFYRESFSDINMVILDMVMPQISGRDLYLAMKKVNPNIRAILSSGYSINEDIQKILDEGVLAFVQKPFQMSEIGEAVYRALGL